MENDSGAHRRHETSSDGTESELEGRSDHASNEFIVRELFGSDTIYMHCPQSFAQAAAFLCHPDNQVTVKAIPIFYANPLLANTESAQQVATYFSITDSLTSVSLDRDERDEPTEQAREVVDLWLQALIDNDAICLEHLHMGEFPASPFVLRSVCQSRLTHGTLEVHGSHGHDVVKLTEALDPIVSLERLNVSWKSDGLQRMLEEMSRLLPTTSTLEVLDVHLPHAVSLSRRTDATGLFLSPSVQRLILNQGFLDHVPANTTLRELELKKTRLGSHSSRTLGSLMSLEDLYMFQCSVIGIQTLSLQPLLQSNVSTLTRIHLDGNDFGSNEWMDDLLDFLQPGNNLQSLWIRHSPLSTEFLASLRRFLLSDDCRLECLSLDLREDAFDHNEIVLSFQTASKCKSLKHMVLERDMDSAFEAAIAAALEQNRHLTVSCFDLGDYRPAVDNWDVKFRHLNQLNWFGRRLCNSGDIPLGLWPILLARTQAMDHIRFDQYGPQLQEEVVDHAGVLFGFLRAMPGLVELPSRGCRRSRDG